MLSHYNMIRSGFCVVRSQFFGWCWDTVRGTVVVLGSQRSGFSVPSQHITYLINFVSLLKLRKKKFARLIKIAP